MRKPILLFSSSNISSDTSLRLENTAGHDIFYFSERGSATQYYMLCNEKGLLVINSSYVFEENFLKKYAERRSNVWLHQISGSGSEFLFEHVSDECARMFRDLEIDFRRYIADPSNEVKVVRFKLNTLPAVAVLSADAKLRQELERTKADVIMPDSVRELVSRILSERPTVPVRLNLNVDNPTIQQMAASRPSAAEVYETAIRAIYNNAIQLTQQVMTPDNAPGHL